MFLFQTAPTEIYVVLFDKDGDTMGCARLWLMSTDIMEKTITNERNFFTLKDVSILQLLSKLLFFLLNLEWVYLFLREVVSHISNREC